MSMTAPTSFGPGLFGNAVALPMGAVSSLALHGVLAAAVIWAITPPERAPQEVPQAEMSVEAYQVPRSDAAQARPDAEAARQDQARAESALGGAVPLDRARPALPPAENLAAAAPPADVVAAASAGAQPVAAALPAATAAEAGTPQGVVARAAAPQSEGLRERPPPSEAALPAAPRAEVAAATPPPATGAAVVAPVAAELAAAPPPAAAAPAAVVRAEPAKAAAAAPTAAAAIPSTTSPALAPATAEIAAAPRSEAPRETAPQVEAPSTELAAAPGDAVDLAAAAPPRERASAATPPAEYGKAVLAPIGPDGKLDAKSLAAVAALTAPADPGSAAADLQDGLMDILTGIPCARIEMIFDPDTGEVVLRGNIPDATQAEAITAGILGQIGTGLPMKVDLRELPPPQCSVLGALDAAGLPQSTEQSTNTKILGAGGFALEQDYKGGQPLNLDLQGADYPAYIYVDFYTADGQVLHLIPNDEIPLELVPAKARYDALRMNGSRGPLGLQFGPPYGREIAVAYASSVPLYEGLRPLVEPARDYLPFLQSQIATTKAATPDFKGEWVYFLITSHE